MVSIQDNDENLELSDGSELMNNRDEEELNEEDDVLKQNDDFEDPTLQRDGETNEDDEIIDEPEDADNDISITNVEHSRVTIAGRDLFILDFYREGIKVAPVNPLDVEKNQAVFVEPNNYQEGLNKLLNQRLLVIQGQPHMGKYSCALGMAYDDHVKNEDMPVHVLRFSEDASLGDFLDDDACPENSVFLILDAFVVPGLSTTELERHASQLNVFLEQKKSFAILTVDTIHDEFMDIPDQYSIHIENFPQEGLLQIFDRHIAYYNICEQHEQFISSRRLDIALTLGNAININRFVQYIARENEIDEDILQKILLSVNTNAEVKKWFTGIEDLNVIFYAILVALCPNLSKDNLWITYDKVINFLLSRKVRIKASLEVPEEKLQKNSRVRITEVGALDFEDPSYRDFILEKVLFGYIQQLRSFLPLFTDFVIQNQKKYSSDQKSIRIAMANAVGEVCRAGLEPCYATLRSWAKHRDATVRTCVAHALRKTTSDVSKKDEILGLLNRWRSNPDPKIKWTVAATWERLYPYFPKTAFKELEIIAADSNDFVRSAVAHALASIARRDQDSVFSLINDWIFNLDDNRKKTAEDAFQRIIADRGKDKFLFFDSDTKLETLPIIIELCSSRGSQINQAMGILKKWVENSDEAFRNIIEGSLLEYCRNSTAQVREQILDMLEDEWIHSECEEVYRFSIVLVDLINELPQPSRFEFDFTQKSPDFEINNIHED